MSLSVIPNFNKQSFTDEDIISGINKNEDWAIRTLIRTQYGPIKKMVFSLRNTLLEPDDIFQEGLMRLIVNIRAGRFRNKSSLATYLNRICRNICLKMLTYHKTTTIEGRQIIDELEDDSYYDLLVFISELKEKTEKSCREILDLRFKQSDEEQEAEYKKLLGFSEIATKLNITSANARQRFKRCLDQLRELVLNHPKYQEFLN